MDVFIALLALPKAAFLDTTGGRTRASKLIIVTVQMGNRECAFGSSLDLV